MGYLFIMQQPGFNVPHHTQRSGNPSCTDFCHQQMFAPDLLNETGAGPQCQL